MSLRCFFFFPIAFFKPGDWVNARLHTRGNPTSAPSYSLLTRRTEQRTLQNYHMNTSLHVHTYIVSQGVGCSAGKHYYNDHTYNIVRKLIYFIFRTSCRRPTTRSRSGNKLEHDFILENSNILIRWSYRIMQYV